MFSPALRHRQAKLARHAALAAGKAAKAGAPPEMPEDGPVGSEYRQLLAQMHEDLRQLHEIQSLENKAAFKASAIGKYLDWCKGALEVDEGAKAPQDEILVYCFIWALDIANWQLALDLLAHIVTHGLQMPEQYHRSPAAVLVSDLADAAIKEAGSVPHEILLAAKAYVEPTFDMKDNYRARLHRALGESWELQAQNFDPSAESAIAGGPPALIDIALAELRRALELDKNVGVKKQIQQLEREAKKLAEAAEQN